MTTFKITFIALVLVALGALASGEDRFANFDLEFAETKGRHYSSYQQPTYEHRQQQHGYNKHSGYGKQQSYEHKKQSSYGHGQQQHGYNQHGTQQSYRQGGQSNYGYAQQQQGYNQHKGHSQQTHGSYGGGNPGQSSYGQQQHTYSPEYEYISGGTF